MFGTLKSLKNKGWSFSQSAKVVWIWKEKDYWKAWKLDIKNICTNLKAKRRSSRGKKINWKIVWVKDRKYEWGVQNEIRGERSVKYKKSLKVGGPIQINIKTT